MNDAEKYGGFRRVRVRVRASASVNILLKCFYGLATGQLSNGVTVFIISLLI